MCGFYKVYNVFKDLFTFYWPESLTTGVYVYAVPIEARRGGRWIFWWLWAAMGVLGTKLVSFPRAATVLNYWASSPVPQWFWVKWMSFSEQNCDAPSFEEQQYLKGFGKLAGTVDNCRNKGLSGLDRDCWGWRRSAAVEHLPHIESPRVQASVLQKENEQIVSLCSPGWPWIQQSSCLSLL